MDYIDIKDIRAYGYVGFLKEEQTLGQWFSVDLRLHVELQSAAQTDDLTNTVNYAQIIDKTQKHIASSKVALIETLAANILSEILEFDRVQVAEIALTKLAAPIPQFSGTVAVQMTRSK
jgi:dihydroneopterin aldolase